MGCIVNYRYQLEERIVEAIEQGEFEKACLAMKELQIFVLYLILFEIS